MDPITWFAIGFFIAAVIGGIVGYMALRSSAKNHSVIDSGTLDSPIAEEGRSIPVLFGCRIIEGYTVVYFGNKKTKKIKS